MARSSSKFLTGLAIGAIVLVALNIFWFGWLPHTAWGRSWATGLFSESGRFHNLGNNFLQWHDLGRQNSKLKAELAAQTEVRSRVAQLERENENLQEAINLSHRTKRDILPAGIYDVSLAPDGYTALVNKGANDGVAVGDAIVGEHSVLVGTVRTVFAHSSRVTLISDPSFKVTVLVLDGQAKGIAHGALQKGMTLDLVIQTDEIKEGDTLVSSGNDMLPPGLIIGTVNHVDNNSAKLFKEVSLLPAAELTTGRVFILKP